MSFENLIKILGVKPINSPSYVSTVGEFRTKVSQIVYGDIFIGKKENFDEALQKGAFVIISDEIKEALDDEAAWIKVDSIEDILIKILRFKLLNAPHKFFYFEGLTYDLLKSIAHKRELVFIENDLYFIFDKITKQKESTIFVCNSKALLSQIYPNFQQFLSTKKIKIISSTLFMISFVFEEHYFEHIHISPLFQDELTKALTFLSEYNIGYDLKRLKHFNHFRPLSITKDFIIKEFGESIYTLIVEENSSLLKREISFLKERAKWAKTLFLLPSSIKVDHKESIAIHYINDLDEIFKIEVAKFNFILIVANYNELYQLILQHNTKKRPSLFEEF